jgi:hypothetical protein
MKKEENKTKPLPIIEMGKDEMNLVEFPITLLSKRHTSEEKTIEFSDTIVGEGNQIVKREWIVTGSDKFGLPLSQDNDVWMALLLLGKEQKFESRKIGFSRYKLCKIMGWEKGGSKYARIEEALNRLSGVRIYAKNAFWDTQKRGYITKNFGIIDDYELFETPNPSSTQLAFPFSYINLNEVIYNSIKSGYIKNLDIKLYFKLKSVISKRLYRYLDKKRYGKGKFEINLFTLAYSHIGFDKDTYKYSSDIKRKLDRAHDELIQEGFLKSAEYMPTADGNSEKVVYLFGKLEELPESEVDEQIDEKESEEAQEREQEKKFDETPENKLLKELTKIGVTEVVSLQLVKDYSIASIKTQIKALPYRGAKKNPVGMLVKSIQENWELPTTLLEEQKKEEKKRVEQQQQIQEEMEKAELRRKKDEYIASLSCEEMSDLTKEAKKLVIEHGGNFSASYYKNKAIPEHVIKSYISMIVEKRIGL